MEPATAILLQLVLLGLACLAAVFSAWFARKNNVRSLREELDILSEWAEKAVRASRTSRMREVRAAARSDQENVAPPELKLETVTPGAPSDIKKALRQKAFGRGLITH